MIYYDNIVGRLTTNVIKHLHCRDIYGSKFHSLAKIIYSSTDYRLEKREPSKMMTTDLFESKKKTLGLSRREGYCNIFQVLDASTVNTLYTQKYRMSICICTHNRLRSLEHFVVLIGANAITHSDNSHFAAEFEISEIGAISAWLRSAKKCEFEFVQLVMKIYICTCDNCNNMA